jgi:hypothetical protein
MANQQLTYVRIWATNGESGEPAVAVSSITSFTSGQLKLCHGFLKGGIQLISVFMYFIYIHLVEINHQIRKHFNTHFHV